MFCAIETVVRNHFGVQKVRKISNGEKQNLIKDVQSCAESISFGV